MMVSLAVARWHCLLCPNINVRTHTYRGFSINPIEWWCLELSRVKKGNFFSEKGVYWDCNVVLRTIDRIESLQSTTFRDQVHFGTSALHHPKPSSPWAPSQGFRLFKRAALPLTRAIESCWNRWRVVVISSSPVCREWIEFKLNGTMIWGWKNVKVPMSAISEHINLQGPNGSAFGRLNDYISIVDNLMRRQWSYGIHWLALGY